eukprot:gene4527-8987_t
MNFQKVYLTRSRTKILSKQNPHFFSETENINPNVSSNIKEKGVENYVSPTKRMKISDQERKMDGAPLGELFDVKVMCDSNINPSINPHLELESAIRISKMNGTSWADKYEAVETFRRLALHHPNVLVVSLDCAMTAAIDGIECLRSSSIRNGIHCVHVLLLKFSSDISDELFDRGITRLMLKIGTGPRFISDIAQNILTELLCNPNPWRYINALKTMADHKNADISNKALVFISKLILKLSCTDLKPQQNLEILLNICQKGLRGKKVEGKEKIKVALKFIQEKLGVEEFLHCLQNQFPMTQVTEILLELTPSTSTSTLTSSSTNTLNNKITNPTTLFSNRFKTNDKIAVTPLMMEMKKTSIRDKMKEWKSSQQKTSPAFEPICLS